MHETEVGPQVNKYQKTFAAKLNQFSQLKRLLKVTLIPTVVSYLDTQTCPIPDCRSE